MVPEPDAYFRIEWELVREGVGMFDMITPRGASELIIESPRPRRHAGHHGPRSRSRRCSGCTATGSLDLKRDNQIRDILDLAVATTSPGCAAHHPYSRITAIPIVFDETRRELREAREYYQYKRRCLYCDILRQEIAAEARDRPPDPRPSSALVPYAARGPLELWILPRQHACSYEDSLTAESGATWRSLLSDTFARAGPRLRDPGYELVLHTAPNLRSRILQGDWATIRDDYHWHIEIVTQPERANRVGGIFINETPPEQRRPSCAARSTPPSRVAPAAHRRRLRRALLLVLLLLLAAAQG